MGQSRSDRWRAPLPNGRSLGSSHMIGMSAYSGSRRQVRGERQMRIGVLLVLLGALAGGEAKSETCVAPDHPSCTVSCPKGCLASFREPNGPCTVSCDRPTTTCTAKGHPECNVTCESSNCQVVYKESDGSCLKLCGKYPANLTMDNVKTQTR